MISRNTILNSTHDGLDIFRHYLGRELRVGRKFRNPFYQDTHASCSLYFDRRSEVYKYRDFGNEDYAGDCFDLVATLHNLSCRNADDFVEILRIINRDLCLGLSDEATVNKPIIRPRSFVPEPARKTPLPYKFRVQTFQTQNRHGGNNTASTLKHLIGMVLFRWQNIVGSATPAAPIRFGRPHPNLCSGMCARME